ncbi:hypothetical protein GCM10027299_49360 [Larkinella ripae]
MNGQSLTGSHGASLCVINPVKYGVKNPKGIGDIRFADHIKRLRDYLTVYGYRYFIGL